MVVVLLLCGCIGNLWGCPRRSLPSGELGAAPSTHVGCELLVVSIAAMVALSGVLMLCGADKSQARWFEHRTRRRRRRSSWRACCTLARTPAVEGLVVHIPRAVLGTPGVWDRLSS